MNTASRYIVAFTALGAGAWLVYQHGDARVAASLIFFAGVLTDYTEIASLIVNLVKSWKGQ